MITIIIFNSEASLESPGEASLLKTDFAPLPSNRSGRERTGQEMPGACEADEKALGWASLHGNRQKRTCGCREADGRWLLWASRNKDGKKRTRRHWDGRRCTEIGRNGPADAAKRTKNGYGRRRCVGTCRNGQIDAAKRMGEACCGLRGTRTGRSGRMQTQWDQHRSSEADERTWRWASRSKRHL